MAERSLIGKEVTLGDRHAVRVGQRDGEEDDTVYLHFLSPEKEADLGEDGKTVLPRASAYIEDGACVTQVALSLKASYALRNLLNEMFP
ncbi:MAG: hypothetical protein HGA31_06570 [Candidatus Moranbacteria bacterium]|nr:hypothetical protein [Candidatus Moranbacteria bacterium]